MGGWGQVRFIYYKDRSEWYGAQAREVSLQPKRWVRKGLQTQGQ